METKGFDIKDFIPTSDKRTKKAKPSYQKPDSLKQLEKDYYDWKYEDSPIPPQCRIKTKFRDDTANGLTGCIGAWCKINGAFFQRNNSQGQYDAKLGRFRRSGSTKGIADTQITLNGKTLNTELKIGRDRQSDIQKKVQQQIEAAGGYYAVVKCFDDFINEINKF